MSIAITAEGILQVEIITADESHIIADPTGANWTVTGNGTSGALTATDGAGGTAEQWVLYDANEIPWEVSISSTGILSTSSFEQNIVLAPVVNAQVLLDGVPAVGYELHAYDSLDGVGVPVYKNVGFVVEQSTPIALNRYGFPTNPIHIAVGNLYDFVLTPPGGGFEVKRWRNVSGGITQSFGDVEEFGVSSVPATYVSGDSVRVIGDARLSFPVGRIIRYFQGTYEYGVITASSYDGTHTTITITVDSVAVSNVVTQVAASLLNPVGGAVPSRRNRLSATVFSGPLTIAKADGLNLLPVASIALHIAPVPDGYLECNGAAVSRTTYAALFAAVSTTFGAGDGSTTFNVPTIAAVGSNLYCIYAKG